MNTVGNKVKRSVIGIYIVLLGCSSENDKIRNTLIKEDDLIQISLSTDGRKQDTTDAFAIELNKDFSVNYYGGSRSDLAGNYIGKIEQSDWDKLLKSINCKQIRDTTLSERSFEDNYFDLSIKFRHKEYYINGFYSQAPQYIQEICELVLSHKRKINFTKTRRNHLFEVKAYKVKQRSNDNIHFTVPEVK
jgi:hypothetical protein